MKTWSGLDAPLEPYEGTVSLVDLVVMLGRTRRFGGCGALEWTVLHHSVLVALLWLRAGYPREELHHALLHDSQEAYIGDIPNPVKAAVRAKAPQDPIRAIEDVILGRIYEALATVRPGPARWPEIHHRIKICDYAALVIEAALFASPANRVRQITVPEEYDGDVSALVQAAVPELHEIAWNRTGVLQ
jgi:hypothetical protein